MPKLKIQSMHLVTGGSYNLVPSLDVRNKDESDWTECGTCFFLSEPSPDFRCTCMKNRCPDRRIMCCSQSQKEEEDVQWKSHNNGSLLDLKRLQLIYPIFFGAGKGGDDILTFLRKTMKSEMHFNNVMIWHSWRNSVHGEFDLTEKCVDKTDRAPDWMWRKCKNKIGSIPGNGGTH